MNFKFLLAVFVVAVALMPTACTGCPQVQPDSGMDCREYQGLNCDYGTEECCGETFPEIRYSCGESNLWAGYYLHHCQGIHRGVLDCPTTTTTTTTTTGCPTGWVEKFGQCYQFSTEEKTWNEADMHCRSNEAHLVSIGSPEEHEFIFLIIREWVWTGGNFNGRSSGGRTGTWNWSDGTPWEYQKWFYRQPSSKGAGGCRAVQIFSTFAMSPCQNRKKFICEKEASGVSSGSYPFPTLGCPTGSKFMLRSCYQWFYTTPKTWNDAENHCQQLGGHLTSLSEECGPENESIGKTTRGKVWIGGKKVGSEWTWSDGTPWNFGNIRTAPSPNGGDCSVTFAGRASGFDCNKKRFYICRFVLQ